ncbi:MAG TPA: SelT/SelW/SelH family protein [Sandaracinaceae bacterium LLY-WYZ-13_1]|nr:SelT/SelW/SelH family protein [Sandaracinaceae bacterium LLY-WYZ-13_1]
MSEASLEIVYCPRCRWLPRAAWLAQELLFTFERGLRVTLRPGDSGELRVSLDGEVLFDRRAEGRFPEPKELKRAIRDRLDPERDLGHSDR